MGHLDSAVDSTDLSEGSRVELPLWLAVGFHKKRMVTMELPKHFEKRMKDEILAGASKINLREFSFYFFEVGMALAVENDNVDLRTILTKAFCGDRYELLTVNALSR